MDDIPLHTWEIYYLQPEGVGMLLARAATEEYAKHLADPRNMATFLSVKRLPDPVRPN